MYWKFIFEFLKIIYSESSMKINLSSELIENIISKRTVENCFYTFTDKSVIRINTQILNQNDFSIFRKMKLENGFARLRL